MRKLILTSVGVGAACFIAGMAVAASQPHMEAALSMLQSAQQEIHIADQAHDHGGHAGAATSLIDQAIHEVREGIRYRNEHGM
jgi:hypothetical protein